jgi:GTPase Era involved in 16S rRNA processing
MTYQQDIMGKFEILLTNKTNVRLDDPLTLSVPDWERPLISIIGTPLTGKSSLINAIYGREIFPVHTLPEIAWISREVSWLDVFTFIDSPGYDPDVFQDEILRMLNKASVVIQVCSAEAGILRSDRQLAYLVSRYSVPHITILNKIDLISGSRRGNLILRSKERLQSLMVPVSTKTKLGLSQLLTEVCCQLPQERQIYLLERIGQLVDQIKLAQKKNKVRRACEKIIKEAVVEATSMEYDARTGAKLLTVHALMIEKIAEQFSRVDIEHAPVTLNTKVEFFLGALAQELTALIPRIGQALGDIHAMVWTEKVGYIAIDFFEDRIDEDQTQGMIQRIKTNTA